MRQSFILLSTFIFLISPAVFAGTGVGESGSGFLTSLPPNAPELISPADDMADVPDSTAVVWRSTPHTSSYTLQVSYADDFTGFILTRNDIEDTSFALPVLSTNTSYFWRVGAVNAAGAGEFSPDWHFTTSPVSAVKHQANPAPKRYALLPAYPNPFNPAVNITYEIPEQQNISLVIYNSMGQVVRALATGVRQAGSHTERWDGRDNAGEPVTSGIYMSRLTAGNRVLTQKMLLMR